ncbi:efflux RND transporter periplasmic adaptor subunit [Patescibacteria group bacterium]|nr:efflux RND transporter periplasmic adaptor subunit [Patescibacteria group bacterium]
MLAQLFKHKLITGLILLVFLVIGYKGAGIFFKDQISVEYVTATARQGTLIISVYGSGQVSATNQIDIKPKKVSGDVASIEIKQGQAVKKGAILILLDSSDARNALRDAETSLETAQLQLEELLSPIDELTLFQAESALVQAEDSLTKLELSQETNYQKALQAKQKAIDNIDKGYEDGFNTIETVFFNVPNIMTNLREILYEDTINEDQLNLGAYKFYDDQGQILPYIASAENDYRAANLEYSPNLTSYKNTSRYASQPVIEALLTQTLATSKAVAQAVKSEKNVIDYVLDYISQKDYQTPSVISVYQTNLGIYLNQVNTYYSNLLSRQQTIQDNKDDLVNAETDLFEMDQNQPLDLAAAQRNVEEKQKKLADLKAGADDLDIRGQKIIIQQKQDALSTARQTLANYSIRALFNGIVAEIKVKQGDAVSSSTVLLSLITEQKIAEISLNEVDVAQVAIDQPVTLTFDAVEEVTLTGKVIEIDALGAINQGIVSYGVTISFDLQDERIKSGMTVDASIVSIRKDQVILVPNAAVQTRNGQVFVQILENEQPINKPVQVGLSNEELTEIISGLLEGELVVTATLGGDSVSNGQTNARGGFRIPGVGGGRSFRGGGGFISH